MSAKNKAPEQINVSMSLGGRLVAFDDNYGTSYTRTDVAQAQVAAAYETCLCVGGVHLGFNSEGEPDGSYCMAEPHDPIGMSLWIKAERIRALTPADAKAALDRIVQDAVKEERRHICKMLCDMGEAEFQVNNSHDAQLLYHAASKVAALKGGEA